MRYNVYQSGFMDVRTRRKNITLEEWEEALTKQIDHIKHDPEHTQHFSNYGILAGEITWHKDNKPYYNIHPSILPAIERVRLDNIPSDFIMFPDYVGAFVLNYPYDYHIKNVFVCRIDDLICYKVISKDRIFLHGYSVEKDKSIEDLVKETENRTTIDDMPIDQMKMAIRSIAICNFLKDCPNDDLIRFDIVNSYIREFELSNPQRREEIINLSKKRGKNGYNVGVSEKLFENAGRLSEPKQYGEGDEQRYAHIRTGHLHCVRYGEGKKHVKVMWFRPIIVNKDKPFKETYEV